MQVEINHQIFEIDDADKVRIHLPGTDWAVTFFGHRQDDIDLVVDRNG